jgi:uncharacterized repeat protein (TIGR03809 family)
MSGRHVFRQFDNIAQRWRDLAERRRDYFIELYRSGRWRHYYGEAEFVMVMREVVEVTETWARIAPRPAEQLPAADDGTKPASTPERRAAA